MRLVISQKAPKVPSMSLNHVQSETRNLFERISSPTGKLEVPKRVRHQIRTILLLHKKNETHHSHTWPRCSKKSTEIPKLPSNLSPRNALVVHLPVLERKSGGQIRHISSAEWLLKSIEPVCRATHQPRVHKDTNLGGSWNQRLVNT